MRKRKIVIRLLVFLLLVVWSFGGYFFLILSTHKIKNRISPKKAFLLKNKAKIKRIIGFIKNGDIWTLSLDARISKRLTLTPEKEKDVQVFSDGKKLVYVRERNELVNGDSVWVLDIKSGKESVVTAGEKIDKIRLSYDNKFIAYVETKLQVLKKSEKEIFYLKIASLDGKFKKNITPDFLLSAKERNIIDSFDWSHDGEKLVFSFKNINNPEQKNSYIHVVNKDGTNEIALPVEGNNPIWSSDDKMIAVKVKTKGNSDVLRLISLKNGFENNSFVRSVRIGESKRILSYNWSEDDRKIAYVAAKIVDTGIALKEFDVFDLRTEKKLTYFLSPDKQALSFEDNGLFWGDKDTVFFNMQNFIWSANLKDENIRTLVSGASQFDLKRNISALYDAKNLIFGGRKIVYINKGNIWVMSSDGSHKAQLTQTAEEEKNPAISPNGRKIVYVRKNSFDDGEGIWMVDMDGSNQHKFFGNDLKRYFFPNWSSDSKRIIFGDSSVSEKFATDLWSLGISKRISPVKITPLDNYYYFSAKKSFEGKKIVFTGIGYSDKKPSLWISRSGGNFLKQVNINNMNSINSASFSPDGEKIIFSGMEASNGSFDLWLVNPDGSNLYRITSYKEIAKIKDWKNGGALYPDWSYGGREIVFYSRTMKDSKISAINPDGSGYRDLSVD